MDNIKCTLKFLKHFVLALRGTIYLIKDIKTNCFIWRKEAHGMLQKFSLKHLQATSPYDNRF